MLNFPALFEAQPEGGFTVTFRDVPEAITQGDSKEEALSEAAGALVTAMEFYFEEGRPVPAPSKARKGEEEVSLPVSISAKVLLLNAMLEEKKRPADLARAMHVKPQEVNRIMDLHHATKIDTISDALQALGKRMVVQLA
jgi:antitoxin HicB